MSDNYSESYNSISSDSNFSDCDSDSSDSSDSSYSCDNDTTYGIWCDDLQKYINFDSTIMSNDVEMFDLTTIVKYFNQTNEDIVSWFTENINLLHLIDSVTTGCDIDTNQHIWSISEKTITKFRHNWFVNENVLISYLQEVDLRFMHEVISQLSYNRTINSYDMPSPNVSDDEE